MAASGYVNSDGAQLYYETRGDGPPVLIVQGGASDARATAGLVDALASTHRVITYDRRGLARSSRPVDEAPVTLWTHAADAAAVIGVTATDTPGGDGGPAGVVGTSIGALIGLHLLVAHPERVAHLVAHEPPMTAVVLDEERERAMDEVADLADREGPVAAIRRMAEVIGLDPATMVVEDGVVLPSPPPSALDDLTTFFAHDVPAVRAATLVADDLRADHRAVLTLTGGELSRGRWEYRCAEVLARACDLGLVEMPGAHNGMITHPRGTAEVLRTVL